MFLSNKTLKGKEKMKKTKLKEGIYEAEITLYKSGNVRIKITNLITKKTKSLYSKPSSDTRYIS